jgi:hypothetical protein
MIEVLKEFLLFGVIEVFILLMFYKYGGKIDKVKYWHGLILCVFYFAVGLIQMPFVKQISMIFGMFVYICILQKEIKLKYLKITFLSLIYLLCVEILYSIVCQIIFSEDLFNVVGFYKFLLILPTRIIDILLILLYKKYKK